MRMPKIGDIWLVHYPYITPGNMEKVRPAIIKSINEDEDLITVQKLSTKYHKGSKIIEHPKLKRRTNPLPSNNAPRLPQFFHAPAQ